MGARSCMQVHYYIIYSIYPCMDSLEIFFTALVNVANQGSVFGADVCLQHSLHSWIVVNCVRGAEKETITVTLS